MANRREPKLDPKKLVDVHARLFPDDVRELKRIAEEHRMPWQIELRQLIHRALNGERREVVILKEQE